MKRLSYCALMGLVFTLACAKKEASETPAPAPAPAASAGPTQPIAEPTEAERHAKMVENAEKAIPSVARDEAPTMAAGAPSQPTGKPPTAAVEEDAFLVTFNAPGSKAGQDGVVSVTVTPKAGWKINTEFPTKLKVAAPADVTLAKTSLAKADAVEFSEKKGATWKVAYKASSAGAKKFDCELRFAVCTDATCDPKKAAVAFAVNVE